ncbi:MAG: hypothetical protein U1E81_11205 [Xanthobacteraceae bacterium]
MADSSKKDEAQRQFDKLQKAEDGKKAMSEYEAQAAAIRAKTERLRALRLARDAALETAPATAKSPGTKATRVKKQPARKKNETGASLSEWLDAQEQSGRRR